MASRTDTIKYYINIINTAVRGEDVRMAIVELLKLANNSQSNANTLDGHSASYFAKQSDMDQILPLADGLIEGSTRPVGSGDLYNYLNINVRNELNEILQEFTSGTITDKIEDLADVRYRIMTALNEKGAALTTQSTFESFADKIEEIPVSMNFQTETLNVTENDTYTAPENKAYTTVKVEVNPKLVTKTVKSLGTFKAKDEGEDVYGFSEVTVELDSGSGGGEGDLKLVEKAIDMSNMPPASGTERSKTFDPSDDEALGYSKVTVNTAGLFGEPDPIEVDPSNFGEERTFLASDDNLYGYSKIVVRVVEAEGPFTVEFWNGTTKIETVYNIKKGEAAICTMESSIQPPEGQYFAGWSPDPYYVTRNMKCYAQFKDDEHHAAGEEINKSWDDIGKNGGADIPVGAYKTLYYEPFDYDTIHVDGGSIKMYKIAAGSDSGTTSTWVSDGVIQGTANGPWLYFSTRAWDYHFVGWYDSDMQRVLNEKLYNAIANTDDDAHAHSGAIIKHIKNVTKYTRVYTPEGVILDVDYVSSEKIWLPSARERNPGNYYNYTNYVESTGPQYTFSGNSPSWQCHTADDGIRSVGIYDKILGASGTGYDGQVVGTRFRSTSQSYRNSATETRYKSEYVTAYNALHPDAPISETMYSTPGIWFGFCT